MPRSFNYISFADRNYIAQPEVKIEMSRGRMFEYTPTEMERRLENLDPRSVSFLETLPTFLCSEISRTDVGAAMVVRYGRVENTAVGRKEVTTNFTTLIDFGEVGFANIQAATTLFGADAFELYRTHWAVRDGEVQDILNGLALLKPEFAPVVAQQVGAEPADGPAQPPPRSKVSLGEAESVEGFLQVLYAAPLQEAAETFFRGHHDARFELTPSLLRRDLRGVWQFMPKEDSLCKELLIAHYEEFQADQFSFDRLVRMQHYGLPTRLLDITSNPLVALYFACEGPMELADAVAEVVVFNVTADKVKYYDSDTVSCISNLSNMTYDQKNEIDLTLGLRDFNKSNSIQKLLHHIKSEKGFFEDRIVPDDLGSILCVKAKRTNTRIRSQAGAFLLFGHEAALPDVGVEGITVVRVTIREKERILRQLSRININATTVYPSIEQTAAHLRTIYRA